MHPQDPIDPNSEIEVGHAAMKGDLYESRFSKLALEPESLTDDERPPRRWWTALVVPAISFFVFVFFSGLMMLAALLIVHGRLDLQLLRDPASFRAVSESRVGLFLVVVVPQIALLVPCLMAASVSPTPFFRRLGLVRGHIGHGGVGWLPRWQRHWSVSSPRWELGCSSRRAKT